VIAILLQLKEEDQRHHLKLEEDEMSRALKGLNIV